MGNKSAVRRLTILVELLFRSILALEGPSDSRYLSLAFANHIGDCCRIREPHPNTCETANHVRLPGTPLWLAATYSTTFASINKRWTPSI